MKILCIGDTHIKVGNLILIDTLISKLQRICEEQTPDLIIHLGDLLNDHARLHTSCLNKALTMINILRSFAPLRLVVGNHDMESGALFLTKSHWMNVLKDWDRVKVIDQPIREDNLLFCPYVPPGRLIEALDRVENWRECEYLFCHQEFKGCSMGMIVSETGDEWNEKTRVISGHIHGSQKLKNGIYYVGSSTACSFSETKERHVLLINEKEEIEIPLSLPQIRTIDVNIGEDIEFKTNEEDKLRIRINGTEEEYKTFKKSRKYKELVEKGVKIIFNPPKKIEKIEREIYKSLSFKEIFDKEINNLNVGDGVKRKIIHYRKKMEL